MAREPETIEREIEQARDALATALDQLGTKASPARVAESARSSVQAKLDDPKVRYALIGVGAIVAILVVKKIFS